MAKAHYSVDRHDNEWVILAGEEKVLTTDTRRHAATIAREARELLKSEAGKSHPARATALECPHRTGLSANRQPRTASKR
jgi:hypothetical protein